MGGDQEKETSESGGSSSDTDEREDRPVRTEGRGPAEEVALTGDPAKESVGTGVQLGQEDTGEGDQGGEVPLDEGEVKDGQHRGEPDQGREDLPGLEELLPQVNGEAESETSRVWQEVEGDIVRHSESSDSGGEERRRVDASSSEDSICRMSDVDMEEAVVEAKGADETPERREATVGARSGSERSLSETDEQTVERDRGGERQEAEGGEKAETFGEEKEELVNQVRNVKDFVDAEEKESSSEDEGGQADRPKSDARSDLSGYKFSILAPRPWKPFEESPSPTLLFKGVTERRPSFSETRARELRELEEKQGGAPTGDRVEGAAGPGVFTFGQEKCEERKRSDSGDSDSSGGDEKTEATASLDGQHQAGPEEEARDTEMLVGQGPVPAKREAGEPAAEEQRKGEGLEGDPAVESEAGRLGPPADAEKEERKDSSMFNFNSLAGLKGTKISLSGASDYVKGIDRGGVSVVCVLQRVVGPYTCFC